VNGFLYRIGIAAAHHERLTRVHNNKKWGLEARYSKIHSNISGNKFGILEERVDIFFLVPITNT